jgi:hypothetical protein
MESQWNWDFLARIPSFRDSSLIIVMLFFFGKCRQRNSTVYGRYIYVQYYYCQYFQPMQQRLVIVAPVKRD